MHLSPTGLHFWPREGSWTVGGRGGPGLTQGRRTENHDVSRLASWVAVRVGNVSHSYHPEGFYTGARSPVVWCGVVCRRRCYQKAKGPDVYPRVKVNGLGCVCCVRAVRKCVGLGKGRGSRGDLVSSPLATALIPGAPAAPLPFLLAGAGAAPATPTPSCCPGPGGRSAVWHAPWRGRTRSVWTPPRRGGGTPCPAAVGSGQCNSCNALPHCLGAVGSATSAMHCLTALGQLAVELLQCTASLPGGSGQCNFCNALPHCPGAVGSGTPAMNCLSARGQWAVQFLQCTALLPWGSGQWNSCNALPHCLGAVGSAASAMHCLTALGQWAVDLLQCTALLPGGSGQCNSCNTRPHCLGAVGSATSAMHCLTALGQ